MNSRPRLIILCIAGLFGLWFFSAGELSRAAEIDFQRDVQPILAEHFARCHGPDAAARKSELRLDSRDIALKGGESGMPAIVPNKPEESELVRRVTSTDPDTVMPPPDQNNPLKPEEIATLTKWISEGANYTTHWAFVPPQKAAVARRRVPRIPWMHSSWRN